VYIPPLGLLGLGFGCPSPVVGAELEAGFAAVRCAVEGVAAVVALVLFLVVPVAAVSFLCCSVRLYWWWKRLLPPWLLLQREAVWLGGLSEVFFSIFVSHSVCEVAPRTFCLLCFGGGGGLFRSSVGLPTVADFLSSSFLHKRAADTRSSSKLRLGVGSRRQLLRHLQGLASLVKVGDEVGFASSFLWREGAPVGRFGVALCNSRFSQGASCKVGGVLCFVLI
jgi:hypothetical protein